MNARPAPPMAAILKRAAPPLNAFRGWPGRPMPPAG